MCLTRYRSWPRGKWSKSLRNAKEIGQFWLKLDELEKMVQIGECKIPSLKKPTPFGRPTQAFHRLYQMTTMAVASQ